MTRKEHFAIIDALTERVQEALRGHDLRHVAVAVTLVLGNIYEEVAALSGNEGAFQRLDAKAAPIAQKLAGRYSTEQMVNVSLWFLEDLAMSNIEGLLDESDDETD